MATDAVERDRFCRRSGPDEGDGKIRKRNALTAISATVMVLQLLGGPAPVQAQAAPDVGYVFSPTSGPQGTVINVTNGTGCPNPSSTPDNVVFLLFREGAPAHPVTFTSTAAGTFSGTYSTAQDDPGEYLSVIRCETTGKGGFGDPFTVTPGPGSTYKPLVPARILDTRDGTGMGGETSPIDPGGTIDITVTGAGGVPASGVTAVALNVVAVDASGPGSYLTVWPAGTEKPLASNLNFDAGVSVPNLVVVRVGAGGKASLYNNAGTVHVVADVQGWFTGNTAAPGSTYVPLTPARVLDTRDGTGQSASGQLGPGATIDLKVTGVGGVPATGVEAVALNVTTTGATGSESFLTVWPAGTSRPLASHLNFAADQDVPNLVIARVGTDGNVSIYNNVGGVDVIADVQGYFAAAATPPAVGPGSNYHPRSPARILDSRTGLGIPGGFEGQLGSGATTDVQVAGVAGVPANATGVVLNVTVAESPGPPSYVTVYPSGTARPLASNLNYVAGQSVANLVFVRLINGKVSIYNNVGSTVVIADVQGWFTQA